MNFSIETICGYYAICQNCTPLMLCQGLTNAQTIIKIMEYDAKGEVCSICYKNEEAEK